MKFYKVKEFIRKWLYCNFFHYRYKCHPEVWKEDNSWWHCTKCQDCNTGMSELFDNLEKLKVEKDPAVQKFVKAMENK